MPELVITDPQGRQSRVKLCAQEVLLGRDPSLPSAVNDPSVSKIHARVFFKKDAYHIEDTGSENGLFLGMLPIRKAHRLFGGEVFRMGDSMVRYHEDADPTADVFTLTGACAPCLHDVFPLPLGDLGVGSAPDNALCISHPSVAPYHALLHVTGHSVTVEDLNTVHGTYVQGIPVHTHVLASGDALRFGGIDFTFQLHLPYTPKKTRPKKAAWGMLMAGMVLGLCGGWFFSQKPSKPSEVPALDDAYQRLWEVERLSLEKAESVLHHDPRLAIEYVRNVGEHSPYAQQAQHLRIRAEKLKDAHTRWLASEGH